MKLTVLGASAGISGLLRTTALLLDEHTLMDCGTGVGDLSLAQMARIERVLLTHSHLDHCGFLPLLADATLDLRSGPLTLYALPETLAILRRNLFNGELWPDYTTLPNPHAPYIRCLPIRLGETLAIPGATVTALPAAHSVPAVGYAIDSGHGSFVFSGDTGYCAAFWEALGAIENLRYLMIENTFAQRQHEAAQRYGHMTAGLLAQGLAGLTATAEILITHLEPGKQRALLNEVAALAGRWHPRPVRAWETFRF